jgi:hypothetical protein
MRQVDCLSVGDRVVLRDVNCREVQRFVTFRRRTEVGVHSESEVSLSTGGTIVRQCSNPEWFVLNVDGLLGAVHVGSLKPFVVE